MEAYKIAEIVSSHAESELGGYDALTKKLLHNRGIDTREKALKFLNPDYARDIYDPFLILNMGKAVDRILSAIGKEEKIIIYGDYDCDGIPGSVVLHDFFKKIGYKNFSNYIPHRNKEGYGLNIPAIESFARDGVTVMITVDLAITDINEIAHAQSNNIDVIVTDHHLPRVVLGKAGLPQEILPNAYTIINSKQKGDTYPDKMLCGAGVAFKLVQALVKRNGVKWGIKEGWEKWLLDMAGLSTIADMVPLQNENRALAHYGLKVLRKSPRPGVQNLLRKMKINQENLNEEDISFMFAPRINAASRIGIPFEAFRLLSTKDEQEASELAEHLHKLNDNRKEMIAVMMSEVTRRTTGREMKKVIVIGNPNWSPGLLGILASNLVEKYERPAFVWGRGEEPELKGSCRSDGTVNMVEMMTSVRENLFLNVGGHEFSGGFSISHENIHFLEEELITAYARVKKEGYIVPKSMIDCTLELDEVNDMTYRKIEKLSPFGVGNPKPTFLFENIEITAVKNFGKEKNHLELIFQNSRGNKIPAIGFFTVAGDYKPEIEVGKKINLVATMEKSFFKFRPEIRLRIIDIL